MKFYMLVIACSGLLGCATIPHNVEPTSSSIVKNIYKGDHLDIKLKDGKSIEFVVIEVTNDSIKGADVNVPIESIEKLVIVKKRLKSPYNDIALWLLAILIWIPFFNP